MENEDGWSQARKTSLALKALVGATVAMLVAVLGIWTNGFRTARAIEPYESLPARVALLEQEDRLIRSDAQALRVTMDSISESVKWTTCVQWRTLWGDSRDVLTRRCGVPPEERIR